MAGGDGRSAVMKDALLADFLDSSPRFEVRRPFSASFPEEFPESAGQACFLRSCDNVNRCSRAQRRITHAADAQQTSWQGGNSSSPP